jgi:hypothetical protein
MQWFNDLAIAVVFGVHQDEADSILFLSVNLSLSQVTLGLAIHAISETN